MLEAGAEPTLSEEALASWDGGTGGNGEQARQRGDPPGGNVTVVRRQTGRLRDRIVHGQAERILQMDRQAGVSGRRDSYEQTVAGVHTARDPPSSDGHQAFPAQK